MIDDEQGGVDQREKKRVNRHSLIYGVRLPVRVFLYIIINAE